MAGEFVVNHGDVRWCDMPEPDRRRPAVILTRQSAISYLSAVTVAPITGTLRDIPSFVSLSVEDGLYGDCVVNCDAIMTLPKSRVGAPITSLRLEKLAAVESAVRFALGL